MTNHVGLAGRLIEALAGVKIDLIARVAWIGELRVDAPTVEALTIRIGAAIYDEWHRGGSVERSRFHTSTLDHELAAAVPHTHTLTRARVLDGGRVSVSGVVVRMPEGHSLNHEATVLKLPAVRPRLSPGYLLADGSLGTGLGGSQILRTYLHVETTALVEAWGRVLRTLEGLRVPYRAKVLTAGHARRDGLVIYLGPSALHQVPGFLSATVDLPGLLEPTSVFARRIGPGVAVAWEPDERRPGRRESSFGQHRGLAIAEGLIAHARTGASDAIATALRAANTDPAAPERNLTHPTDFPGEPARGTNNRERNML